MKLLAVLVIASAVLAQQVSCNTKDYNDEMLVNNPRTEELRSSFQWSGAERFQRKINERLNDSDVLATKPQIKQNIQNLAKEKLQTCKTSRGDGYEMGCVGRITGHMMQLIAEMEKGHRDLPGESRHAKDHAHRMESW